jgi:hypothetical protein
MVDAELALRHARRMLGIHVFAARKTGMARDIGERSDAVLRTAIPGRGESMI